MIESGKEMAKNGRKSGARRQIRTALSRSVSLCSLACIVVLVLSACATPKLPPPPPKYVQPEEKAQQVAANSLWLNGGSLFEDPRARRLNDLLTIYVLENISASNRAATDASRDSSLDAAVTDFFGLPLSASVNGGRYNLTPTVSGSMKDDFKGSGATTREGKLIGTITAKVVEVMPNGNFVLESRKDITINNEKQILVLRGMIRPEDIEQDNSITSSKLADAEVYYVGDGVIQNKQRPGWLVRFLDKVWPF
jgi:flagellar L-ring protein precursor FlgH